MPSHRLRVIIIAVVAVVALIGVIVLTAMGISSGTGFGVVAGVLTLAVPALIDSSAVEARRLNPDVAAMPDDIRAEGIWANGKREPDWTEKTTGEGNNAGA